MFWPVSSARAYFTAAVASKANFESVDYPPPHWVGYPLSNILHTDDKLSKLFQFN
jgi:hypothetical protein